MMIETLKAVRCHHVAGTGMYQPRLHAIEYGLLTNPEFNENALQFVSRTLIRESLTYDGDGGWQYMVFEVYQFPNAYGDQLFPSMPAAIS